MAQITIKTSKEHRCNKSVIIAGYNVKFDDFCMAEIPDRYLENILNSDSSISLVDDADVLKYKDIKESSEKNKEVSNIDIIDENSKLKLENEELKKLNKKLAEENTKLGNELQDANKTISKLNEAIDALQGEEKEVVEKTTDTVNVDLKEIDTTPVEETSEEDNNSDIDIDGMKKAELQELCKGLELPTEEWESLKVEELKSYVKQKIENTEE